LATGELPLQTITQLFSPAELAHDYGTISTAFQYNEEPIENGKILNKIYSRRVVFLFKMITPV